MTISPLASKILSVKEDVTKPNRDTELLAPFFEKRLSQLIAEADNQGLSVALFEGYRSPQRQSWLYEQGRSRAGKIVTRAAPWKSWHQLSVAADVVFYDHQHKQWHWDGAWDKLHAIAHQLGFETLDWENPHLQIRAGLSIDHAVQIAKSKGAIFLWKEMEDLLGNP
jgi:peptidoglycan L-alanyl-D-glutamate endopeptidase CwlK